MNSLQGEEGRGGGEEETLNGLMIQLTKLWCQSFLRAMSDGFTTIAYEHTKGYTYVPICEDTRLHTPISYVYSRCNNTLS